MTFHQTARRHLHRLRRHPDFEDLVQEAALALWLAGDGAPPGLVCRRAAAGYLEGPQNLYRRHRRGTPYPEVLTFAALGDEDGGYEPWAGRRWLALAVPDFAPALLDWLDCHDRLFRAGLHRTERQVLALVAQGATAAQIGRRYGRCGAWAGQVLARLRVKLGVPPPAAVVQGIRRSGRGWAVEVKVRGRKLYLGTWPTPEEARLVRDAGVLAYGVDTPLLVLPDGYREGE